MRTSMIAILSLLSSLVFAQTITTEVYSKKINVIRRGANNNGQLIIKAFKHNAKGSNAISKSFELYLEHAGSIDPNEVDVVKTTTKTKLLKPDLDTIFNCLNTMVPSIASKKKKNPSTNCSFFNFVTGYNEEDDSHYVSINDVVVLCNRRQMMEFIKSLKEVKAILIE